jgi:anaerobic magnesium-protoporphyrin IX monomethyl ester cyclase
MADVLLAHPFFLHRDAKQWEKMRPYPPLGTLYAAANLRRLGYSVALFDAMLAGGEHEFETLLDRHRPSIVAIYEDQFNFVNKMCLAHTRQATAVMAKMARRRGAHVIATGSDVTDHPESYLKFGVHYALVGEPDHTLAELVGSLLGRDPRPVYEVPGVVARQPDGQAAGACRRLPERDLDVFPFPAWDLVDVERYRQVWLRRHGYFSVNMVSTRGCPYPCTWCAKPIWGQRYATRSPANVAAEMAWLKANVRPDHLWFADDIFGLQPEWIEEFAREVELAGARLPFMVQSRVDLMQQATVDGLARAGCVEVWLGVESGSQRLLDAMHKGITVAQTRAARRRLAEAGIRACFFLQFGYPGERFEDIMATVQLVRELMPDEIGVSVCYPLPGTRLSELVRPQLADKDHWDDSDDLAMLFQGTYRTPFYRKLHHLLHRDLELRQKLHRRAAFDVPLLQELDALAHDWFELGQMEVEQRSPQPTRLDGLALPAIAPDLSRRWN